MLYEKEVPGKPSYLRTVQGDWRGIKSGDKMCHNVDKKPILVIEIKRNRPISVIMVVAADSSSAAGIKNLTYFLNSNCDFHCDWFDVRGREKNQKKFQFKFNYHSKWHQLRFK